MSRRPGRVKITQGQVKILSTCPTGHVHITGYFNYRYIIGLVKYRSGLVEFDFTCPTGQVIIKPYRRALHIIAYFN